MNGKKAKKLRREAENLTLLQPLKDYGDFSFGYSWEHRTCRLERCTRATYQQLKKQSK